MTTAVIIAARRAAWLADSMLVVEVDCPYCGQTHTHGAGQPSDPVLGSRISHCAAHQRDAYTLADPDGLVAR